MTHEYYTMHLCLDGQVLATAAADESLKFRRIFYAYEKAPAVFLN